MTNNTIPNVPRELLADLLCDDHDKRIMAERHLLAMLANAPSPAGVDGLACAAALLLPALRQYMHNDGTGLLAGYDLETTEAIIDGLRGKVESGRRSFEIAAGSVRALIAERDQQAQRIGKLEGLLRDCYPGCGLTARQTQSIRERIDAALSAGKDSDQ